ncbi:MAG: hypothetical protein GF381_02255 [Candidatus Pacebacteria bacterium]|nr:hypothetical protein [Candidatus Paceibacterota bacterium]
MKLQLAKNPESVADWAAEFKANPKQNSDQSVQNKEFGWEIKFGEAARGSSNWKKFFSQLKKQKMLFFYQPDAPDYRIMPNDSLIDQTGFETESFETGLETDITESDHQHIE